jgi:hypothetical protein
VSLYYICIGKNKDGSSREEYVEDPDWVKTRTTNAKKKKKTI